MTPWEAAALVGAAAFLVLVSWAMDRRNDKKYEERWKEDDEAHRDG